jgi:hypothetical protein
VSRDKTVPLRWRTAPVDEFALSWPPMPKTLDEHQKTGSSGHRAQYAISLFALPLHVPDAIERWFNNHG